MMGGYIIIIVPTPLRLMKGGRYVKSMPGPRVYTRRHQICLLVCVLCVCVITCIRVLCVKRKSVYAGMSMCALAADERSAVVVN